jgi:hypothetical protein
LDIALEYNDYVVIKQLRNAAILRNNRNLAKVRSQQIDEQKQKNKEFYLQKWDILRKIKTKL